MRLKKMPLVDWLNGSLSFTAIWNPSKLIILNNVFLKIYDYNNSL